jgi:hypothetical protein
MAWFYHESRVFLGKAGAMVWRCRANFSKEGSPGVIKDNNARDQGPLNLLAKGAVF